MGPAGPFYNNLIRNGPKLLEIKVIEAQMGPISLELLVFEGVLAKYS